MKGCLTLLLLLPALVLGYYFAIVDDQSHPNSGSGVRGAWGTTATVVLPVYSGILCVFFLVRAIREKRILEDSLEGRPPRDGELYAATGTATALGEPLLSPLSQTPCIACKYEIFEWLRGDRDDRDDRDDKDVDPVKSEKFTGMALGPSSLRTRAGDLRILGFPDLDSLLSYKVPSKVAAPNFERYCATVEQVDLDKVDGNSYLKHVNNDLYHDRDGEFRKDFVHHRHKPKGRLFYGETLIRPGDQISLIGEYVAEPAGLAPSIEKKSRLLLYRGDLKNALKKVRSTLRSLAIWATVLIVVPNVLLWCAISGWL